MGAGGRSWLPRGADRRGGAGEHCQDLPPDDGPALGGWWRTLPLAMLALEPDYCSSRAGGSGEGGWLQGKADSQGVGLARNPSTSPLEEGRVSRVTIYLPG